MGATLLHHPSVVPATTPRHQEAFVTASADHPDPSFARERWGSLDGAWAYGVQDRPWAEVAGPSDGVWDRSIVVPFPPESSASGLGEEPVGVLWYRRELALTASPDAFVRLHFGAVDYRARVWLDERLLGEHVGGHTPFSFDIPGALLAGTHTLTVAAYDPRDDLDQPRGKQDWEDEPHVIWYRRTSGIWRDVWWEEVPTRHLVDLQWTSTSPSGELAALVGVSAGAGSRVGVEVRRGGAILGAVDVEAVDGLAPLRLALNRPHDTDLAWSPERPTLLEVELTLIDPAGAVLDRVATWVGLRTVEVGERAVLLNGAPWFLRFVLEQCYWPHTHLASPDAEALRAEADLIRDLGFNGLRLHQVTPDPRFLRFCDELGLLVVCDLPAPRRFSVRALERVLAEWGDVVRAHRNHPSIIGWLPYNESWGVPDVATSAQQRDAVAATHHVLKALDPTRIVLGNDGWEHTVGDLVGIHDYTHDPAELAERYRDADAVWATLRRGGFISRAPLLVVPDAARTPVWLSEFGGVSVNSIDRAWAGYGDVGPDELVPTLAALVGPVSSSTGLAGFCYTQLTDTEQEQNGLAGADRVPKAPLEALARIFSGAQAASGLS